MQLVESINLLFLLSFLCITFHSSSILCMKLNLENLYDLLHGEIPNGLVNLEVDESRDSFAVKEFVKEINSLYDNETNRNVLHEMFNQEYGKNNQKLETEFDNEAKELLLARVEMILENNLKYLTGKSAYLLALNSRSDQQFIRLLLQPGGNWPLQLREYPNSILLERRLSPAPMDSIANRSVCVSSLYFTATATVENALARNVETGKKETNSEGEEKLPENLSVQQIIDCSYNQSIGQIGCYNGGEYEHIFEYIKQNGLTTWKRYPYRGLTLNCDSEKSEDWVSRIQNFEKISNDEKSLLQALQKYGPIAVQIHMNEELAHYQGGIFSGCDASGEPNHGALLVGHGFDQKLEKMFWVVKNHWTEQYGEGGYVRLERNGNGNMCGIASDAYFVEV